MSLTKRLAAYYVDHPSTAERITTLLERFKLGVLAPELAKNVARYEAQQAKYGTVHIASATPLSEELVAALRARVDAPSDAPQEVAVRESLLRGVEVSYGGKKWSGDASSALRRFVDMK